LIQLVVLLATFALIGIAYGVWRMFQDQSLRPNLYESPTSLPTPER
jgi:hypothetical protein